MALKKRSKFSIGVFANNEYTIYGVLIFGTIIGIGVSVSYRETEDLKYLKISFVSKQQYEKESDDYPDFVRKRFFVSAAKVDDIFALLFELSNLPMCYLKYGGLLKDNNRKVLLEKYSNSNTFYNFLKINQEQELQIVALATKKFEKNVVIKIKNYKSDIVVNPDENICTVRIPSFHNKYIFVYIRTMSSMHSLYEHLAENYYKNNYFYENMEKIKTKNQ